MARPQEFLSCLEDTSDAGRCFHHTSRLDIEAGCPSKAIPPHIILIGMTLVNTLRIPSPTAGYLSQNEGLLHAAPCLSRLHPSWGITYRRLSVHESLRKSLIKSLS